MILVDIVLRFRGPSLRFRTIDRCGAGGGDRQHGGAHVERSLRSGADITSADRQHRLGPAIWWQPQSLISHSPLCPWRLSQSARSAERNAREVRSAIPQLPTATRLLGRQRHVVGSRGLSMSGQVGPRGAWYTGLAGFYCVLALVSCAPRTIADRGTASRTGTTVPRTVTRVPHTVTTAPS
jgi:hypothetical protein